MKKSQILAALALAFALGVVAPVAGANALVTENITTEQKDALNQDIANANKAYNNLININEYTTLYNLVDSKDGARDFLKAANQKVVDAYNDDTKTTFAASVNNTITLVEAVMTNNGLYKVENGTPVYFKGTAIDAQAKLASMNRLPATVSSADAAYEAVYNLLTVASENAKILSANYEAKDVDDTTDPVNVAKTQLQNIINGLTGFLTTSYQGSYSGTTDWANVVAENIKPISEDAYNTLTQSADWKNVNTYSTNAIRINLAIKAAEALPKYSFVANVVNAKTAFDKITSDQEVRYSVALQYIADFNSAIKAYEDGKNAGTQQPTDPDTKPGDDNKGDDGNKTPTTPGTGIVSTAEGSASTTISIVAGLATALTALGAGVVAYRNARRSSEK